MKSPGAIVLTSINRPTRGIQRIAELCPNWEIIVIGDKKTPTSWKCDRVRFISVKDQGKLNSQYAANCPYNHYARKNIGYLQAIREGAPIIAETDDDNVPYDKFLSGLARTVQGRPVKKSGWENVYRHFTKHRIWPRGFPLEEINESFRAKSSLGPLGKHDCPVQQFLADGDPDVDAIYRLTCEGEIRFRPANIVLLPGTYCPFNSQNTVWWPDAYPLLYLPSYVSFRMTDIWRSFVAQVCLGKAGTPIAFRSATVFQERNIHSFIKDFKDEISGYLNNVKIMEILAALRLSSRVEKMGENLFLCYENLVVSGQIPADELKLVRLWIDEIQEFLAKAPKSAGK